MFVCSLIVLYIFILGILQVVGTKQAFASKWIFTFVTVLPVLCAGSVASVAACCVQGSVAGVAACCVQGSVASVAACCVQGSVAGVAACCVQGSVAGVAVVCAG